MHRNTRTFPNKIVLLLLPLLLLGACKRKGERPPLSEEKMQALLLDIHIAEAYSAIVRSDSGKQNMFGKNTDTLAVYYKEILSRHNISYKELKEGLNWYQRHPAEMDSVYNKVLLRLDSLKLPPTPALQ